MRGGAGVQFERGVPERLDAFENERFRAFERLLGITVASY